MENENQLRALVELGIIYMHWKKFRKTRKRRREFWVHPLLYRRQQQGEYHHLVQEMRLYEPRFKRYFRLNVSQFDHVLSMVGPRIAKEDTTMREAISPGQRLAICLRFLATGDSYRLIADNYRVGISTVSGIITEVAREIWSSLVDEYMPVPSQEDWRTIAAGFRDRWNFPNCVGAIDGKHVVIEAPLNSGSMYFNYKGTYSIVLLAVVDASRCFRVIDVGAYGGSPDGGTLANSAFGTALSRGTLNLPEDTPLPGGEHRGPQPPVFIGDEAFPLRTNLMRPYSGRNLPKEERIHNYRLSRARMVVENSFGILASQWRMYKRVGGISAENTEACVKATCILHNYLQRSSRDPPGPHQPDREDPPAGLFDVQRMGSNNASRRAMAVRDTFAAYFSAEGAVPWQDGAIN